MPGVTHPGITFRVDDVSPVVDQIYLFDFEKGFEQRMGRKVHFHSAEGLKVIDKRWDKQNHPLADAVHEAFRDHLPLMLSPDAIWLTIAQGFAQHLSQNAEQFRSRLVRHRGLTELVVGIPDLDPGAFEEGIAGLSAAIHNETDPVLHETLLCDFSTTAAPARIASQIVLLDAFSNYFTYALLPACGIPAITLKGSVTDWERIRARVEVLATFDLDWWVARLRPILDEFILTASDHPTPEFWRCIHSYSHLPRRGECMPFEKPGRVANVLTGWIADLFPYTGKVGDLERNKSFTAPRENWGTDESHSPRPDAFPLGICSVPVKLIWGGQSCPLHLLAGFFGVEWTPTRSLAPIIGWAVADPTPVNPAIAY